MCLEKMENLEISNSLYHKMMVCGPINELMYLIKPCFHFPVAFMSSFCYTLFLKKLKQDLLSIHFFLSYNYLTKYTIKCSSYA